MTSILDDFPRGVTSRFRTQHKPPLSAWADPDDVLQDATMVYNPEAPAAKILLGTLGNRFIGFEDDRHMVTVAGSRAGKGVSAVIPNLVFYPGSVLAIDPKGELASITAMWRARGMGQKVVILDPFGRTSERVKTFRGAYNPMVVLTPDNPHIIEDAGLIADALVIPSGSDVHWDESAKIFIEGVILHVATYPAYEGRRNLVTVREILLKGVRLEARDLFEEEELDEELQGKSLQGMEGLRMEMEMNDAVGGLVQASAIEMFDKPEKEFGSILSSARRHTTFLSFPAMKEVLKGHDFDLPELKTAPGGLTIYLCLPAGRMGSCNRWLRLFVNLALEAMEREDTKPNVPVLLCLDEFATLGRMEQVEVAAGQIAGFGCKMWTIIQDLGQLESLYKDRWQTFIGNAGVLQFFGNNDVKTLDYISKRLGQTAILVETLGEATAEDRQRGKSGVSQALQVHDLLSPEEASRYFGRDSPFYRQLIIIPGRDPLVLGRILYYKEKLITDRCYEFEEKQAPARRGFFSRLAGH